MKNIKRILVAIDSEPSSSEVASAALQLMQQLNAHVALVSVIETPAVMNQAVTTGSGIHGNPLSEMEIEDVLRNSFKERHHELLTGLFKKHNVPTFIEEGSAYQTILRVADEWKADLIVLGTNGRKGLSHLMIGSVAEKVMRHSDKPVLVIPINKAHKSAYTKE